MICFLFFIARGHAEHRSFTIPDGPYDLLYDQGPLVTGVVTDENGEPLPGATVRIKGTSAGTVTDFDGVYELSLPETGEDYILQFSFIGYISREIALEGKTEVDISLETDVKALDEVVVVGYGTQRKGELTSSIASLKSDDFVQAPVRSPLQLLQGKVAGLAVGTPSGDPNAGAQIMLRGASTLEGNSQPLIIIDGIPGGNLSTVAPEDIESIDVLKDGSAAAIYGTRGTNGVIIITTRSGKGKEENRLTVDYHGYMSYEEVSRRIPVFSASEYRGLMDDPQIGNTLDDKGYSTDWWDEISRKPVNQVHTLLVNGGNGKSGYTASVSYRSRDGVIKNSDQERLTSRLSLNHSAADGLVKFNFNINNTQSKGRSIWEDVYRYSLLWNPTDRVMDEEGNYTEYPHSLNPVQQLLEETDENKWSEMLLNGKITIEPLTGLRLGILGGFQRNSNHRGKYANKKHYTNTQNGRNGNAEQWTNLHIDKTLEITADYNDQWGDHSLALLGGYGYYTSVSEGFSAMNYNFPTDAFSYNNIGVGKALQEGLAGMSSYKNSSTLISFFGRVNYSYKNRFMFMASLRQEGSSKFGADNKWGLFPSFSGAWRISEESFLRDSEVIDDLKIRLGYGVTGTMPNDPYLSLYRFAYGGFMYSGGEWIQGVGPYSNPNPNLKWETKRELNAGIDFTLWNSRLSGSLDLYQRNTSDLLYTYNVPVPPNLVSTIYANVGKIRNRGIELVLNVSPVSTEHFHWQLSGNVSYNENELTKLSNETYERDFLETGSTGAPIQKTTHLVREGHPLGDFYGWVSQGVDENGNWIIKKANEDGAETDADREVIGNGVPKMFAGLTSTMTFRQFDFTVGLRGAFMYQILNHFRMKHETFSYAYWNHPKTILDKPYGGDYYLQDVPKYVSYYIEDGDYVKLDNVSLGYTFRLKEDSTFIKRLRVYLSGLNLHTFTGYTGVDPEVNFNGLAPGVSPSLMYPTTSTYTLGLQLGF
ncbi:SusC/RagA family TonB-linked outer membrane protein [Sinomicrobium soli]|nr:SusC/RagA family TonB-linked outer membrane protein [Sinomicrobium sp. N-1-3-6]